MKQADSAEARVANAESSDPRVRRTRRMLRDAALDLVGKYDFAEITIGDITRLAEINRATFYQHYRDKEDLIIQALDDLFEEFTADDRAFAGAHGRLSPAVTPPPLVALFRRLAERPELYRRLLGDAGSSAFARRHRAFYEEQFLRMWSELHPEPTACGPHPALRARAAAAQGQGVIAWWLEYDQNETAETMAAWMWQFCCEGLGLIGQDD